MEFRAIKRSFTISINVGTEGGEVSFPTTLPFDGRNVYGVIGHLNNADNSRTDIVGQRLINKEASVYVRLEGSEPCDTNLLFLPLENLSIEGKNIPYLPLAIGKLLASSCKIKLGQFVAGYANKVVMLTFITD